MTLRISGKNINIGDALRTHVSDRLNAATGKYFDGSVTGHVTIEPEGTGYRADCTLHLTSGVTLQADGRAQEVYAGFDQSAERIESRLRRYKSRLKDRSTTREASPAGEPIRYTVLDALDEADEAPAEHEFKPAVIAESEKFLQEFAVSAAVLELDLSGAPMLVFRHATTNRVNVIYRRINISAGSITPEATKAPRDRGSFFAWVGASVPGADRSRPLFFSGPPASAGARFAIAGSFDGDLTENDPHAA